MSSVVVIGGGHNGLVCAAHLAKSGVKVIVLEARDRLGGLAAAEEFHPGYKVPGILHDTGHVRPQVVDGLGLAKHGLQLRDPVPIYAPGREGAGLLLHKDAAQARSELAAHSERDAAAYAGWREFLGRSSGFLASVLNEVPPPLNATTTSDFFDLGKRGLTLRRLGREHMVELMRVVPMCVADWLNELFETQLLSELLAGPAVYNTFMGPWSAGSAVNLLLDEAISGQELVGGPSALIDSLTKSIEALGVEIKTHARVQRIRVESGRVCGVTLDSGEDVDATTVISTCDPKQSLLELVDPIGLTLRLEEQLGAVRARGTAAKVHLALSGPIEWKERSGETFEAVRIGGGDLDALERAFDAVKYRRFSERPNLDVRVPSVSTEGLAPAGHHVASILVSFVPYDLDGGWSEESKAMLADRVIDRLAEHTTGLRDQLVAHELLTPVDLEARYGTTGGHLHHGERALDQMLFMRPSPSTARYETPIEGLFLGGSGSHPGGGVTGAPGLLAASQVAKWVR